MKNSIYKYVVLLVTVCCCSVTGWCQMNTDRLTAIGRNALYFDDYVLSIQYFNQVIKLKPYLPEPYLYRGIAKIQLGDLRGAERDCNAVIERSPFMPGAYYTRGFIYRQLREYEKAERDFNEALDLSPENRTYLLMRADVRLQRENYDGALADLDFLLSKEPNSSSLHLEKGITLLQKKDTMAALSSMKRAAEEDPLNSSNWSALGVIYSQLGDDDEALLNLNKSIGLGSRWAGDYINRGILYYRRHNYRGALADYDKAIELEPKNGQCYYNRGILRHELGDYNNALTDYNEALERDPDNIEIHYQRGVVNLELKQWEQAISDFDALIAQYPYFLPSYYLAAQAYTAMGNKKSAFQYRQRATDLEKDKDKLQQKKPNTDVQSAEAQPSKRDKRKEFSNKAAQNQMENQENDQYTSIARGAVQKKNAEVVNQPNVVLSYYAKPNALRRYSYSHYLVDTYNQKAALPGPLHFTLQEVPLTAEMAKRHFDQISAYTQVLDGYRSIDIRTLNKVEQQKLGEMYFARAIEFALVQDYNSALDDASRSLLIQDNAIIYFCRANWRYKLLEYQRSTGDEISGEYLKLSFEMILRDYDKVILMQNDFAFAAYNKANMLCTQRDFKAAITYYSMAIEKEPELAEAYFNRGLTYVWIGENEKGIADLSKAGELGIYQAYNIMSKFE